MANEVKISFTIDGITKEVKNVEELQAELKKLGKEAESAAEKSKKLASEQGFIAEKVEGLKKTFSGLKGDFANLTQGVTSFFKSGSTGAKIFKASLAALGIPLLISLVVGLINYFKNFEVVTKLVDKAMNALSAVFAQFGKAIAALLSGNFKGAKDAILGIGDAASSAAKATDQLYAAQKRLNSIQQANATGNAKLRQEIEGYKKILEDTTKGEKERLAALAEVTKRTKQLAQAQLDENAAAQDGLKAKIALEQNEVARRDLQLELAQLQGERIDQQTELNNIEYDAAKVGREIRQATADQIKAEREKAAADKKAADEKAAAEKEKADKEAADAKKKAEDEAKAKRDEINAMLKAEDDQALLDATTNAFEKARVEIDLAEEVALEKLRINGATDEEILKIQEGFTRKRKALAKEEADYNQKLAKDELNGKLAVAASAFDAIAGLLGENSAAGKAAAVASATINTYQAATNALANTPLPPPFPQIAAGVAIASGLMNVKKILATKVPGDRGASNAGATPSVPSVPRFDPNAALAATNAGAGPGETIGIQQPGGGQQQSQPIRAYVIADEVTSQQEANKKINDLSKL